MGELTTAIEQLVRAVVADSTSDDVADSLAVHDALERLDTLLTTTPPPAPCTADDYQAAAEALTDAQRRHGDQSKAAGSARYRALLTPPEFHNRALELARSIAASREAHDG